MVIPHADRGLARLPNTISWEAAIVMACALSTGAYGVEVGSIRATDTVMILGLGAVGLCMVLSALAEKAERVIGVDSVPYRRDKALELGAHEVGDPTDEQWADSARGTVDVVLIATANAKAVETTVYMAAKGGRITVIGSQLAAQIPFVRFDQYGLHLFGTWSMIGGNFMEKIVEEVASGTIDARKLEGLVNHVLPLDKIKEAYELFSSYSDNIIKIAVKPT